MLGPVSTIRRARQRNQAQAESARQNGRVVSQRRRALGWLRLRPWALTLLGGTMLCACSGGSTGTATPVLHLGASATSNSIVSQYNREIGGVTWTGGWRLVPRGVLLNEGPAQVAALTYGSAKKAQAVKSSGLVEAGHAGFAIVSASSIRKPVTDRTVLNSWSGDAGFMVLQFTSSESARRFFESFGRPKLAVPGITGSEFFEASTPSGCPAQCGFATFSFSVKRFIVAGGINCKFQNGCADLAYQIANSVNRSIDRG